LVASEQAEQAEQVGSLAALVDSVEPAPIINGRRGADSVFGFFIYISGLILLDKSVLALLPTYFFISPVAVLPMGVAFDTNHDNHLRTGSQTFGVSRSLDLKHGRWAASNRTAVLCYGGT